MGTRPVGGRPHPVGRLSLEPLRAVIELRLLGPPALTVDGADPAPPLRWRKNLALLAYLARSPRGARTRAHLRGLLWGDRPESAARHSLNEALRVIRRHAGEELVRSEGRQVALAGGLVRVDTDALERHLATEAWDEAATLVGGTFMEGFGVPDASAFEDWLAAERVLWTRHSVRALAGRAEACLERADLPGASAAAARALALDPLSDAAARAAMRAAALAGERGPALELFADFERRLRTEVGASPAPETVRLADRIRLERSWRLPEPLRAASASRRAALVGREAELAEALAAWRRARYGGRAALLFLEGESGVGKTRLAEEVAARARLEGGTVAAIRSVPGDRRVPWSGLLGLCRGLLEAPGLLGAPVPALARIARELPEWGERFRAELAAADSAAAGGPGRTSPEAFPLARAFSELLRAVAAEQPLLLCLDDAEWLDRESAEAVAAVLRDLDAAPLLVSLAVGGEADHPTLDALRARLGRELRGSRIALAPLGPSGLRALAAEALPDYGPEALDRLVRRVHADSAGLPLLAVEILHAVRVGLELNDAPAAWPHPQRTLDQTMPAELPDSVVSAIRTGFRRLSPEAQRVLTAAAVIGGRVEPAALARATGLEPARVAAVLDELEWARWLAYEARGYSFLARVVARTVARDMATEGQRRRILERAEVEVEVEA